MKRRAAVSIAELLADGVPVHPSEAVAIVRRVCASADDHPPRVSHATDIVLVADGELVTGTGRLRRQPVTLLLAALLRSLLDRSPLGHRASPALSEVVARGLGSRERPAGGNASPTGDAERNPQRAILGRRAQAGPSPLRASGGPRRSGGSGSGPESARACDRGLRRDDRCR